MDNEVKISGDVVKNIVHAAIAAQLGDGEEIINRVISEALEKRGPYNKQTSILEDVLESEIRQFAKSIVNSLLENHRAEIETKLSEQLVSSGLLESAIEALKGSWSFRVDIKPHQ